MARVLLVEQDVDEAALLESALTRGGYVVQTVDTEAAALAAAALERPEVYLLAAELGAGATGLVQAIRGVDLLRPILVLGDGAASGEPSMARPIDPRQLLVRLRQLLADPALLPQPAARSSGRPAPRDPQRLAAPDDQPVAAVASKLGGDFSGDPSEPALAPDPPAREAPPSASLAREATSSKAPPSEAAGSELILRRREVAAKALADAQMRRKAAEAAHAATHSPDDRPAKSTALASSPGSPVAPPKEQNAGDPVSTSARTVAAQPSITAVHPGTLPTVSSAPAPEISKNRSQPIGSASLGAALFDEGATEREAQPASAALATPLPDNPEPNRLLPDSAAVRGAPKVAEPPRAAAESTEPLARRSAAFPPAGLDVPLEGDLDQVEPAALLVACHRARLSGQLQLDQGPVRRTIFLDDGRLVGAASTSSEERLEALCYRRSLITRDQQRSLRADAELPTRRLALLMVERSFLKPTELFSLVQERVELVIHEACGTFVGRYRVGPERVADDERVALARSPLAVVVESVRRKYLIERLLAHLGGPASLLRPVAGALSPELSEFGLSARERRLAQAVDGLRNIEELLFENGIEPLPGLQVLYALTLGQALEVAVRGLRPEAGPDTEARIDLGRVSEKYQQVRAANYFEILGLPPSATAYEISDGYARLSRDFEPARFRELPEPALPAQLEEIQRVLAEARDILLDERLRDEYRAHLRK